MVRVVIDTNVLVSAIVGHGRPRTLVSLLLEQHTVLSSTEMMAELYDVLSREKFRAIERAQIDVFLSILAGKVVNTKIKSVVRIVKQDPDDDVVLSVARDGRADFIISGDPHLLRLKEFENTPIVSVRKMLEILM